MKTIGILGGMGPQASAELYQRIIAHSQEHYGAKNNASYPHLLVSNLPVPDFIESRKDEDHAVGMVEQEAQQLERAGAQVLVIACNTMHLHIDRFRRSVHIHLLSVIEEAVSRVVRDGLRCVGLLWLAYHTAIGLVPETA